jgi:glutamate mutase epsilon subunit
MKLTLPMLDAIKLADGIVDAQQALKAVDPRLAWRLAFNLRRLADVLAPFQTADRALAEKHARRDDNGALIYHETGGLSFVDGDAWLAERQKLLAEEADLDLREIPFALLPAQIDAALVAQLFLLIAPEEDDAAA